MSFRNISEGHFVILSLVSYNQFIQETLNKLAERPKTDTQLDLFSYDTG
ncbi:hypothetical protein RU86_GL001798 [Lactococcus piscium]|uniref:Uncharacterized protein n=1 Tax=Pseudolactococcus piscium TaxID=1364 RepID=A0A2A5RTV3_9LACT|nr:hypothetical protein RU86_GL001798 [Lactococcus piscium]